jgi:hypothetical protein
MSKALLATSAGLTGVVKMLGLKTFGIVRATAITAVASMNFQAMKSPKRCWPVFNCKSSEKY